MVQGDGATENLIEALDYFSAFGDVDVIIIGRGGGSIEDLWAFNSESLARKIAECPIPLISAVGHETDFTICDFVADMRAPTPSAAAEIAVPDINEVRLRLAGLYDRVFSALERSIGTRAEKLALLSQRLGASDDLIAALRDRVEKSGSALQNAIEKILEQSRSRVSVLEGKLNALSPLGVLKRGYSLAYLDDKAIKSVSEVSADDKIKVRLSDGILSCAVESKENINE